MRTTKTKKARATPIKRIRQLTAGQPHSRTGMDASQRHAVRAKLAM